MATDNVAATPRQPKLLGGCTGKGFMPGQSGNPAGPKKVIYTQAELMAVALKPGDLEKVVQAQVKRAIKGDTAAAKLLMDRCFGSPSATGDITLHVGDTVSAMILALAEARRQLSQGEADAS